MKFVIIWVGSGHAAGWFSTRVLDTLRLCVAVRFLSIYPEADAKSLLKPTSERFEKSKKMQIFAKNNPRPEEDNAEDELDVYEKLDMDPKLLCRSLESVRQKAGNVHSKVVLSLWLRYKSREDELLGTSLLDCVRQFLEWLKAALIHGYDLDLISVYDHCKWKKTHIEKSVVDNSIGDECYTSDEYDDGDFVFCIGDDKVIVRGGISHLENEANIVKIAFLCLQRNAKRPIMYAKNGLLV
ncbi:hypothetical protein LguiA_005097 [Lonicera macranthoides]